MEEIKKELIDFFKSCKLKTVFTNVSVGTLCQSIPNFKQQINDITQYYIIGSLNSINIVIDTNLKMYDNYIYDENRNMLLDLSKYDIVNFFNN